ncbi:MAG: Ig-like domain-containing protein [Gemmatimonadales bacterium]
MRGVRGTLAGALVLCIACGGDELLLPAEGEPAAIAIVSGDAQAGLVGSALANPLVIRVTDTEDRPVAGTKVAFTVTGGAGTIAPATMSTDADGLAGADWILGPQAGTQTVDARVADAVPPLAVRFFARAGEGLAIVAGNEQSAPVGSRLPQPLVVRVTDAGNNPVQGVPITWAAVGGGSVTPATSSTGNDGRAASERTLGPIVGPETTTASAPGVLGSPVTFRHIATSGSASGVVAVSGDGQTGPAGSRLPEPLVVRILDANDNPVSGGVVSWVIAQAGGGMDPPSSTTGADGTASSVWTLGLTTGTQTVTAVVSDVGSVRFAATASAPPATRLLQNGGDGQSAPAQSKLAAPLSVKAVDGNGNGVGGVRIAWAVASGGGSLSGSSSTTRPDGTADVTWTLGPTLGTQTATAAAAALEGSPVRFGATATIGAASRLVIVTQPSATAASGAPFAQQPVIELRDAAGNAVPQAGVNVTVAIVSGGGTLGGTATRATGSDGRAVFTDLSISGTPGARTLIFRAIGISSVTSSAIQVGPGAPSGSESSLLANPSQFVAGSGSSNVTVTVRDARGTPIPGVAVQLSVSGSGNTIMQPGSTNSSGVATGSFTSDVAGTKTVSATAGGVAIQQTASVVVTEPPPPPPSPAPTATPG